MLRVRTPATELAASSAIGARSRSALPRGSRTAPGRDKGLEENGAGAFRWRRRRRAWYFQT